ncbi:MAG TPA: response regulator transcription factor, partial [Tahibacter sp.]|nr:response regulator transcription factor [Tahibacter sp.]
MISVLLVDDQTLVRQGIRSLLELSDDIRVIAEAGDGSQAVQMIPEAKPDVVLLDLRMPGLSGIDVLNTLSQSNQLPATIILTTFDDDQLVLAGLKAGARGYLLKDVSLDQLVDAVKTVAAGPDQSPGVAAIADRRRAFAGSGCGRFRCRWFFFDEPVTWPRRAAFAA